MKSKFLTLGMAALLFLSCNSKSAENPNNTKVVEGMETPEGLKGTWELKGFYNYQDNVVVDSFSNNTISRQVKMYSDTKVMWCKLRPKDSTEFFGYGSYTYGNGVLTEVLEFGSTFMNDVIADQKEFTFQLDLSGDRFEQIEIDEDGNKIYSENYVRIE